MSNADLEGVVLTSQGCRLFGGLYLAAGEAPSPAIVLLHGLPGHELNLDLAQRLRGLGMHVLYFHYRGSWGSEGSYSLHHCLPDALVALDAVLAHRKVDPRRVAVVGISFGGWVAFAAAAVQPAVRAIVAMSPLLDPQRPMGGHGMTEPQAAEYAQPLRDITAAQLRREWFELAPWDRCAPAIANRPVLLVTAGQDQIFPPEHYTGVRDVLPQADWVTFPQADHVFSDVRPGLCHAVGVWLLTHLR